MNTNTCRQDSHAATSRPARRTSVYYCCWPVVCFASLFNWISRPLPLYNCLCVSACASTITLEETAAVCASIFHGKGLLCLCSEMHRQDGQRTEFPHGTLGGASQTGREIPSLPWFLSVITHPRKLSSPPPEPFSGAVAGAVPRPAEHPIRSEDKTPRDASIPPPRPPLNRIERKEERIDRFRSASWRFVGEGSCTFLTGSTGSGGGGPLTSPSGGRGRLAPGQRREELSSGVGRPRKNRWGFVVFFFFKNRDKTFFYSSVAMPVIILKNKGNIKVGRKFWENQLFFYY